MKKLIRVTTVPISLKVLLKGQLKFISNYFTVIGVSSDGKELNEVALNEGIRTHAVNMTREITPIKDLRSVLQLYRFFKKEKPFIVHSHTPKAGTVSMIAARLAGVTHRIHTVAGLPLLEVNGVKRKLLNLVEKVTYAASTEVLVNSVNLKNIIVHEGFAADSKLKVIGHGSSNGVDTTFFHPLSISTEKTDALRKDLKIREEDFVVIYIGRLVSDKGVNETIKAFNNLYKTDHKLKLLVLGSRENELNPLLPETENIINTNSSIISVGFVNDVRPYLAVSNVLVLASYREGFPNVVLQAGAMAKASIVSDINGCNEIIEHNKTGYIIPVKQSVALENALLDLIENPEKCYKYGENARLRIEEKYSQKYVWQEILKYYQSID